MKVKLYDQLFLCNQKQFPDTKEFRISPNLEKKKETAFLNTFISAFNSYLQIFNVIRLKQFVNLNFKCKKSLNFGCNFSF